MILEFDAQRRARLLGWLTRAFEITKNDFDYSAALKLAREVWKNREIGGLSAPASQAVTCLDRFINGRKVGQIEESAARNTFVSLQMALARLADTLNKGISD